MKKANNDKIDNIINLVFALVVLFFLILLSLKLIDTFKVNKYTNLLDEKIKILEEKYSLREKESIGTVITISDCKNRSYTFSSLTNNTNEDLIKVTSDAKDFIKKNIYKPSWIKIDLLSNERTERNDIVNDLINKHNYQLRKAIKVSDSLYETILLSAELNSTNIINYTDASSGSSFNLNELNTHLAYKNIYYISEPIIRSTYDEYGYFIDENNETCEINNKDISLNKNIDIERLDEVNLAVKKSVNYLYNLISDDGKFDYGYDSINDKNINEYNILRHCGSVWTLTNNYDLINDKDKTKKEKIQSAINYVTDKLQLSGVNAFVVDDEEKEIKLGGNALGIIMLLDYMDNIDDNSRYLSLAIKLASGMLLMKNDDHFNHSYSLDTLQLKEEYRTFYYDGEACYAFLKLYTKTNDEKYLDAAKLLLNYHFKTSEKADFNHWFSYCYNMFYDLKELSDSDIKNIVKIINTLLILNENRDQPSHTIFEELTNYKLFNSKLNNDNNANKNLINKNILNKSLETMFEYQLNTFTNKERAMYYKNPAKTLNAIVMQSDGRIRIDDFQHTLFGFRTYLDNIEIMK